MVTYLESYNITNNSPYGPPHTYGRLWLDIEGPQYWSSSQTSNRNFIQGLIDEANSLGLALGIYTSESQWTPIVGDWNGGSSYMLWCTFQVLAALWRVLVAPVCVCVWYPLPPACSRAHTACPPPLPASPADANYDGEQSFSDFSPFGGWSQPSIKQFSGSGNICGVSVDEDWCVGAAASAGRVRSAPSLR